MTTWMTVALLALLCSSREAFVPARPVLGPRRITLHAQNPQKDERGSMADPRHNKRPVRRNTGAPSGRSYSSPISPNDLEKIRFNKQIVQCTDAPELLQLLQSKPLRMQACGGALSSVNFSTALHRLARHSVSQHSMAVRGSNKQHELASRATTLVDPRFALFLASLAEALVSQSDSPTRDSRNNLPNIQFDSRELANVGWALAKLRIAPPQTALPVDLEAAKNHDALVMDAQAVRDSVLEAALRRQQGITVNTGQAAWVPQLSRLAGRIIDYIGIYLLETEGEDSTKARRRPFQMQEYANLLWSFATAGRASPQVCCLVLESMMRRQRQELVVLHERDDKDAIAALLQPQEWSNSIWSMATAQMEAASTTVGDVLEYVSVLLVEYPEFGQRFKPQEWSNTVWGVASLLSSHHKSRDGGLTKQEETAALTILRVAATILLDSTNQILARMKSQELTNTIWGFSTLGFGLPPSSMQSNVNNYMVLQSQRPEDDAKVMDELVDAVGAGAMPILHKFRSQELNNLAWALTRLVDDAASAHLVPDLLGCVGRELCSKRRPVATQDIGTTLWSFATMKFFDSTLYRGILDRLTPTMISEAKPQELSNIVWAIATAEMSVDDIDAFDTSLVPRRPKVNDHVTLVFGLVGQELMRRPEQFKPQEIKDVLWSFSRIGLRFPILFRTITEYLVGGVEVDSRYTEGRGLDDFSPQGLANIVWAFARQAQLAEDVPSRQPASRLASGNGRLVVYTTSYLDVGERLLQKLFKAIANTSLTAHDNLRKLKPQDLCLTAWAFAVVGLKHSRFIGTARDEVCRRLNENMTGRPNAMNTFKGQELANVLWAMGTVSADGGELLNTLTVYLTNHLQGKDGQISPESIARMFLRRELANIAWSCAVFWTFPRSLMELVYGGLVGRYGEQDPEVLIAAHGDTGLQPQAIMTLIYVQTAICLEGSASQLSLPVDFPTRWQESSPSKSFDHTTDSILELKLSTSKIQRAVSAGLSRVGFAHVEEHVITMHDLRVDYGVDVPESPYEVLSIDMANIEKRIAIEVDGPAHFVNEIETDHDVEPGYSKAINGKFEYQFRWEGDTQEMNGSTVLKKNLLTLLGWKVINIPFWEWYQLDNNQAAEDEYCKQILKRS